MRFRCIVWSLWLVLAVTALPGDDDNEVSDSQLRLPGGGGLPSGMRPIPLMPPAGFGQQSQEATGGRRRRPVGTPRRCGPGEGSCPYGHCCGPEGTCGTARRFCVAPDCQLDYSYGCDAYRTPTGEDTSYIARPPLGQVPYGYTPIHRCTVPKTVALTFDDGPNVYTSDLLDILDSFGAKATFFITGINSGKGQIDDPTYPWLDIIQRIHTSGHQIASHTWSHQDLDTITSAQRREQMVKNEMALRNILGTFPTYMRPPYSSCTEATGCVNDLAELGYHIVYYDVDTDDYNNDSPEFIQRSKDIFDNAMAMHEPTGRPLLVISHDVHEQTVYNLTAHMLRRLIAAEYRPVTLGECLNDPRSNWFRWDSGAREFEEDGYEFPDEQVSVPHEEKQISDEGICGGDFTCVGSLFGHCCSSEGFCGHSATHCGEGCQPSAGICFPEREDDE